MTTVKRRISNVHFLQGGQFSQIRSHIWCNLDQNLLSAATNNDVWGEAEEFGGKASPLPPGG